MRVPNQGSLFMFLCFFFVQGALGYLELLVLELFLAARFCGLRSRV